MFVAIVVPVDLALPRQYVSEYGAGICANDSTSGWRVYASLCEDSDGMLELGDPTAEPSLLIEIILALILAVFGAATF